MRTLLFRSLAGSLACDQKVGFGGGLEDQLARGAVCLCFLNIPILDGRADGMDTTNWALGGTRSLDLEEAGGLGHGATHRLCLEHLGVY